MNVYYLCFIMVYNLLGTVAMAHSQESLLLAHEAYQNKDFARASALYQKIPSKGPLLWYVLGKSAYEMHDYAKSLLYFKRAEQFASPALFKIIQKDIMTLYDYMPNAKHDRVPEVWQRLRYFTTYFSLLGWQLIFLISWFITCMVTYLFFPKTKKGWLFLILVWAFFLCIAISLLQKYAIMYTAQAVVIKPEQNLFVLPDSSSSIRSTLYEGQLIKIRDSKQDWVRIIYHQEAGWIPKESIERVIS